MVSRPLWERSWILFLISVFVRPNWVRHNVGRGSFLMAFHRPPRRATPSEGAARLRSGCAGGRIPQRFFSGRSYYWGNPRDCMLFAKVSARCFHFFVASPSLWERSCVLFLVSVFVGPNWVQHSVESGPFLMAFHRPPRRAAPSEGAARPRSGFAGGRIPQHFFSGRS